MARIAGVDLPRDKRTEIALTYIFGIGLTSSQEIMKMTGVNPDTRIRDLDEAQVARLREVIERNYRVEGDLRREVSMNSSSRDGTEWAASATDWTAARAANGAAGPGAYSVHLQQYHRDRDRSPGQYVDLDEHGLGGL
jgi:ribosomal protein uS13